MVYTSFAGWAGEHRSWPACDVDEDFNLFFRESTDSAPDTGPKTKKEAVQVYLRAQ